MSDDQPVTTPGATASTAAPSATLVTLGETMGLMTQRGPGTLAHSPDLRMSIGGAESNVAIGVCRLGGSATWIGRIGNDEIGDLIVRELRAEGVTPVAIRDPGPTGMMLKTRRAGAVSRVAYYRRESAGSHLSPADIDENLIRSAGLLHVTGITPALGPGPAAAVWAAIDTATAAGVPVSLDVNYRSALWRRDTAADALRAIAARCHIVFAGDDEASLLTPGAPAEPAALAEGIAALGPEQVLITMGSRGCVALLNGSIYRQDSLPVTAVDTVGAGDAFAAGFLTELLAGQPLSRQLRTANAAGAFAVIGRGDWESMPTRSDLLLLDAEDSVTR